MQQVGIETIGRQAVGGLVDSRLGANCACGPNTTVNEYTRVGGVEVVHDLAGNLTGDHRGYSYVYDYENRITEVRQSAGTLLVAAYAYDALGRRIEMAVYDNSQSPVTVKTIRYYYDGQRAVLQAESRSDGLEERALVYGNYIDEVLVMRRKTAASGWVDFFYGHDHLYSPAVLFNFLGGVMERYEYDAYGAVRITDAGYWERSSVIRNTITFTGRELDVLDNGSLKIMYYRARYYDPETGRFMQRDPFLYIDSMNLYEIVKSNPVYYADPFGLFCGECNPPSDPSKNAYDAQIVEWGRTSGPIGTSDTFADGVEGLKLFGAISNVALLIQVAGSGSWSAALLTLISEGTMTIESSLLTDAALKGLDQIQKNLTGGDTGRGWYLWAKVEYKTCVPCRAHWIYNFSCPTYKWKKESVWHWCKSKGEGGSIGNEFDAHFNYELQDGLRDAAADCQRAMRDHPNEPGEQPEDELPDGPLF